jgi:hypothetical protein
MSDRPETTSENDVVQLLLHQHEEIRRLFAEVTNAASADRAEAFDRLRRLLAVHETAEELIVHPDARSLIADGDLVVDACLAEELAAKQMLVELENLGTEAAGFLPKLEELRIAVEDRAKHEEQEEFPGLPAQDDGEGRQGRRGAGPDPPPPRRGVGHRQPARRPLRHHAGSGL